MSDTSKDVILSPTKREQALSPTKRELALSPTLRDKALSPLRDQALSPTKRELALSPTLREQALSPTLRDKALSPLRDQTLSPTQRDRASPSADSRANGSHATEESESVPFPGSPKSIGSSVPVSRYVKKLELTKSLSEETGESGIEDPETFPSSKTTLEGDKATENPPDPDYDADSSKQTELEDIFSTLSEDSDEYSSGDETDSHGSDKKKFQALYDEVQREIKASSVEEVLEKMHYTIGSKPPYPEVHDSDIDDDDYLDTFDEDQDKKMEGLNKEDKYNPSLKRLHGMCWRILNNARLYCGSQRVNKAKGVPNGIWYKFERILQRLSLVDEDLKDMYISTLPIQQQLSYIQNLSSLILHLTAEGDVTVAAQQVVNEINCDRILSHYNGFMSFRKDDMVTLLDLHDKITYIFDERWMTLYPYVSVFIEEIKPLESTFSTWGEINLPMEDLLVWRDGMVELIAAAKRLVLYLIPLLQDCRETLKGFYCIQKTIRNNLITFLTMDISNMFVDANPTSPYDKEFPVQK